MGRKSKVTFEQKLSAVKDYLEGRKSQGQLAKECNVSKSSVQQWISNYQAMGESGLIASSKNTGYSKELKYAAVKEYLSGNASQLDICKKYNIRSKTQLSNWILKYNGHEKLKSSRAGGKQIMTKGRNTTFEERIEIVKYCIEHDRNYNKTAEKYQVSYQQVRNWVIKYDKSGVYALIDRRGKRKSEDEFTEIDRLKAQNKLLEAKNRWLEMENEVLKKLAEIERGRY
ncbi:MAG: helix-turn-helix domain-containing protein [Thermosediminibacteraceae bacterium]|uniref:helix-turn-helix domain-containing protein n=1 Tax=Tepidanaerobacter sp. GT38 TaxID=2722793 RepID=UPI001F3F5984|nr:helix-turn-helix domain-containing protein [Tepidanaerobacter sp. GT38]MCG0276392.1 helix-turn-helix domain-containing protein [Thermosediminibacteraceae bacterium]MCG1013369.1 transposase [Tepidanaerobacter sp. GT38]